MFCGVVSNSSPAVSSCMAAPRPSLLDPTNIIGYSTDSQAATRQISCDAPDQLRPVLGMLLTANTDWFCYQLSDLASHITSAILAIPCDGTMWRRSVCGQPPRVERLAPCPVTAHDGQAWLRRCSVLAS